MGLLSWTEYRPHIAPDAVQITIPPRLDKRFMNRHFIIDVFKAMAAQIIVWHHLLIYSPMADDLSAWAPAWVDFLQEHGRLAVQPFLVMGGFLAMQSMDPGRPRPWMAMVGRRFWRLALPLWIALLLVVGITAGWERELQQAEWASPVPSLFECVLHLHLLQDVWGIPAISAGVWYVAIDLQLYALLAALLSLLRRWGWQRHVSLVLMLSTLASLMVWSKMPALDVWGIYFWAPYGLGALAALALRDRQARLYWGLSILLVAIDQMVEPRVRPVLAAASAMVIHALIAWAGDLKPGGRWLRGVQGLSDMSYGLFVGHFAMILGLTALWQAKGLQGSTAALAMALACWLSAMALGWLIHRGSNACVQATQMLLRNGR